MNDGAAPYFALVRFRAVKGPPVGAILAGIGVAGGAAVALLGLDRLPFPTCYFKALTGLPCPSCGSTRTLGCLVHLDVAGAFAMNPLAALAAFAILAWCLADLALLTRGRALTLELSPGMHRFATRAALAGIAANWAYLLAMGR